MNLSTMNEVLEEWGFKSSVKTLSIPTRVNLFVKQVTGTGKKQSTRPLQTFHEVHAAVTTATPISKKLQATHVHKQEPPGNGSSRVRSVSAVTAARAQ
jgi:hypothetical protein